jgi:D-glycero-D-manno-heptose 1,7-bisphosphate phosphatase
MATESPDQPMIYRKPSPRFITEMIAHHTLDPQQCIMVGDRETDIEAGLAAGTQVAALANGKLTRDAWAKFNFPNLAIHENFRSLAAALQ